jgi:hypothetical protein
VSVLKKEPAVAALSGEGVQPISRKRLAPMMDPPNSQPTFVIASLLSMIFYLYPRGVHVKYFLL